MKLRETSWAELATDIYDGAECNEHRPRWMASVEKEGMVEIGPIVELDAEHFPPGTKIRIMEPVCPECGDTPWKDHAQWVCSCGFNWKEWTEREYS